MTHAPNVVIPSARSTHFVRSGQATTARDLSIVIWVIQSTMCTTSSLCEVLRFAQDDQFENARRI
jgi:hypothetical protein